MSQESLKQKKFTLTTPKSIFVTQCKPCLYCVNREMKFVNRVCTFVEDDVIYYY